MNEFFTLLCPALSFACRITQYKVIHKLVNTWEEITSGWKTERIKELMHLYMLHSVVVTIIVSDPNTPHYKLKIVLFRAAMNACYFFHCGFFESLISGFLMSILFSVVQWLVSIHCFSNFRFLHVSAFNSFYLVILKCCFLILQNKINDYLYLNLLFKWLSKVSKTQLLNSYWTLHLYIHYRYQHHHFQN